MKFEIISMMPNIECNQFDSTIKKVNSNLHSVINLISSLLISKDPIISTRGKIGVTQNRPFDKFDLNKNDLTFIEMLYDAIVDNYHNAYFLKPQLASILNISERQLQRRVKTLIDETPMDLLREYRLIKAADKINNGQQVSRVGFECGFSSSSYFGTCFKKRFGVSPKRYQNLKVIN
jgi:AraC-like DNA-binding protein